MKDSLTDITIILDKSGSMAMTRDDMIGGFNQFLKEQKEAPGEATISLVLFDTTYTEVYMGKPIGDAPDLDGRTYTPGGMTALLDAIMRAINVTGTRLKNTPEDERPGKVIFVIMTDGQENSSVEATRKQVAALIKQQEEKYSWNFVYMGANQDSFHEAGGLNIRPDMVANYVSTGQGTREGYKSLSHGLLRARGASSKKIDDYFSKKN